MTEEERDAVIDLIPADMVIWDFDEELNHFSHADLAWWMRQLDHGPSAPGHSCCGTCGCATTCVAGSFADSLVSSVVRELDRLGLLKNLGEEIEK